MVNPPKEQELLNALYCAEQSTNAALIESAVSGLAIYYAVTKQFLTAAPFWRRGAELLIKGTARDSCELATYLHNMAAMCLIPAGLHDEARATLKRSKELYELYFGSDAKPMSEVDELLHEIAT